VGVPNRPDLADKARHHGVALWTPVAVNCDLSTIYRATAARHAWIIAAPPRHHYQSRRSSTPPCSATVKYSQKITAHCITVLLFFAAFEYCEMYWLCVDYRAFRIAGLIVGKFVAKLRTVKPRLHDATGCQTGCTTGLTTGCIV